VRMYVDGRVLKKKDGTVDFWKFPGPKNRRFIENNLENIPVTYMSNHAKTVVIDGELVMMGSSNFDKDDKAFDANVLIRDRELAQTILDEAETRAKRENLGTPPLPPARFKTNKKR